MLTLAIFLSTPALADDQVKSENVDPKEVVKQWKKIGLTVEIPWRRSNFPSDDYTYISQARGHVGSPGSSGFRTEVECEMLGHTSSKPHQISVGLEVWNTRSEDAGRNLAIKAIKAIGVEVPNNIIDAFKSGRELTEDDWEVADESTNKLKEIRVYYRPASSDGKSGS